MLRETHLTFGGNGNSELSTGGTYFFTVVTYHRQRFLCDDDVRLALDGEINEKRIHLPFDIDVSLVGRVVDWALSTYHRYVEDGVYSND